MGKKLGTLHRFFGHRVLRKAFKAKNEKVTWEWIRPNSEESSYYQYLSNMRKSGEGG
jgi:hypothetical protein